MINCEETIGKTVGRRRPPTDPLTTTDGLQKTLTQVNEALGHRHGRKGVFRFKTHEEANAWTQKNTKPKKS